jgi:hypothetical protein
VDWNAFNSMANEHAAFQLTQMKAGKLVAEGALGIALAPPPSGKAPNGAAATFTSTNWPEVEEIIEQDPTTASGSRSLLATTYGTHANLKSRQSSCFYQ